MLTAAPESSLGSETLLVGDGWWRRHAYILPSFLVALFACYWFVTWGDWNLFQREDFCGYYDAQARSLLAGRLDVPPEAIGTESFNFQGKTYGYFGIAPSLLRIPLVTAFGDMDGRWSRLMMLIACTINLICAYRILRLVVGDHPIKSVLQRTLHSLFILCAGVGSTNVFLVARSFTFHEAIMWGATFGLLFALTTFKYLTQPRLGTLGLAGFFAFMALHSRATVGAGAWVGLVLLSGLLLWRAIRKLTQDDRLFGLNRIDKPWLHATVATAAALFVLVSYLGVNYAKFHTLDGVPLKYYNFYVQHPGLLRMTGGRQIHLENVPTTIVTYLGVHGCWLDWRFPWIFPSRDATLIGSPVIVVVEGFSTFPVSMPALFLLALLGCMPLVRGTDKTVLRLRLPMLAVFLGGAVVLTTIAITERYLHDFYPALIIAAAIGVGRVGQHRSLPALTILAIPLTVLSVMFNCAFALENQRLDAWAVGGVPEATKAEFKQTQKSIYRFFHR